MMASAQCALVGMDRTNYFWLDGSAQ